jgi:alkanesulfonate monooxygenase SsuD/methylene tetrahydromethanopterin reductase-like flavin-dependent oxidoreductase (luciferase family)
MEFSVFDHLDLVPGQDLTGYYEDRLKLVERYDEIGIRSYHLAEHHATPLGMAPSPNLFLAAVAQRTTRLRFGPLVYCLPLYHPLRLMEEICMLDQMSGGRLEMGIGRGISPFEVGYYGVDYTDGPDMYREAVEMILTYHGRHYNVEGMPRVLHPVQRPHPPLWYGTSNPEGAGWPAENGVSLVASGTVEGVRALTDAYRATRAEAGITGPMPRLGMNRFVYVGETDAEAREVAARAYPVWQKNIMMLWNHHNSAPKMTRYVETFEELEAEGTGIAGSPATVAAEMRRQYEAAGITTFICRFAFGDLSLEESLNAINLFEGQVMPALVDVREPAQES